MENFFVAAAGVVGAAVLQEAVSTGFSLVLGKRKEKASQGQYLERLRKSVKEVEFVLGRTATLPITEVSLLRDRFELKRDFIEAACLLSRRNKKRQAPQGHAEISQAVTRSPSPQGLVTHPYPSMFFVSSLIGMTKDDELCLSCDDVERFEHFAESARNILIRVESGCSLRRYMFFPCPLVRHLFHERRTLFYRTVHEDQERHFSVWPTCLEERGLEVVVTYWYLDRRRPDKSFYLWLVLRLSESTDIVGIAIKCLQSLASQFNHVADTAMGELTLLARSNLQDISHSHAPPCVGIQERHSKVTQLFRPNPLCCKSKGHGPCANNAISSELSHVFPEEVILFGFDSYNSTPEYSLRSSSAHEVGKRSVVRKRGPPLQLAVCLAPHYSVDDEGLQACYAIGDNGEVERIDVSIQQVGETVRSRATNCFLRQPKVKQYKIRWVTNHGTAWFVADKPRLGAPNVQIPTSCTRLDHLLSL